MSCLRDSDATKHGPIVLEDDVWIAHGAFVEPGVHIGAGSVVSAGSVVTRDVPPDSLVIGNPAESFPLDSDGRRDRQQVAGMELRAR
jgi:maltose O-acetyltransferase